MSILNTHLHQVANKMPDNTALIFGSHRISYERLLASVSRLAAGLRTAGLQKGDRLAIMLPNLPHFCIAYYAAFETGAAVVPVNLMSSEQEIAAMLQHSGAKAIIYWSGFRGMVVHALQQAPQCTIKFVLGEQIPHGSLSITKVMAESPERSEPCSLEPEDLAVINYITSGSDEWLGAEFSHSALVASALTCHEMYRITAEDRVLAVLPLFHPLGQTLSMNASFFAGASVVLQPRFSPNETVELIRREGVTFMAAVPGIFKTLSQLPAPEPPVPSLKFCLSYGVQLPPDVLQTFEAKYQTTILEAYGFTEAGPLVTSNRINRDRKMGSAGLPLVGVELQILDEEGTLLRPNQSGEIWVKSPGLMQGYHNKPDKTLQRLRDDWFFSGDVGYLDEDHYLYVQERKEDIIQKGGFQIFSFEVEEVLLQHPAVAEAAVVGVADPVQGQEVKAFVVFKPGENANRDELIAFVKETLPVYKSPKFIDFVPSLPKSTTGRVLKRILRGEGTEK